MKVKVLSVRGSWSEVLDACRGTVKKQDVGKDPSDEWKRMILRSEHSPVRLIEFVVLAEDVKSWVATHCVRHSVGITHFVSTQRTDRTGTDRDSLPQGALVDYRFCVNLQQLVHICRERFCRQASPETSDLWREVVSALMKDEKSSPLIAPVRDLFVPKCVRYGGNCYEPKPCGYAKTKEFSESFLSYVSKLPPEKA